MAEEFNVDNCNKVRTLIAKGEIYRRLNEEGEKVMSSPSAFIRKESKGKIIDYSQRAEKLETYATSPEVCKGCKRVETCDHRNK